jgi:hypothetical protein
LGTRRAPSSAYHIVEHHESGMIFAFDVHLPHGA